MNQRAESLKVAKKQVRKSSSLEDEAQMILNSTLDGVVIQDSNRQLKFANSVVRQLFGDDLEQVCNEIMEQTTKREKCSIHCVVDEIEKIDGFCFDKDDRHFRVSVKVLNSGNGSSKTAIMIRDITSVKRLQKQLEQSQKLRTIGQMTLGVAHDFNNTLSAILGRSQLLRQKLNDRAALEPGLRIIEKAALDATETVKRIQHFSKAAGKTEFSPISMGEIINDVVEITRPKWQDQSQKDSANITVFVRSGKVPPIMGNASDLREALANLMINSVEAMPDGGNIRIKVFQEADNVCMAISDTGTGMPKKVLNKALEPFFTTKGMDNSGLGLGIVRGIIESHNGEIKIDSVASRGTTVTIKLPVTNNTAEKKAPVDIPTKAPTANILVIDDEAMIRELFHEILSREGHKVTVASGSSDGLKAFDNGDYDIVYTDLGMPGVSGWEVAAEIKKRMPDTVVAMTTGWEIEMEDEKIKESGIDFVVSKPFQIDQLKESVSHGMKMRKQKQM